MPLCSNAADSAADWCDTPSDSERVRVTQTGAMPMAAGVFYVASGTAYGRYAGLAIQSLRMMENCPVTVFCDAAARDSLEKLDGVSLVDIPDPKCNWNDKIFGFLNAPYEKSVYLDCDTLVIRPFLDELSEALDSRPLMARSAGIAFNYDWETEQYPVAIPQYNTGVIAFRREHLRSTFVRWSELCDERPGVPDQPTFRAALIETGVAASELPVHYNFVPDGQVVSPVRIYHLINNKHAMNTTRQIQAAVQFARSIEPPAVFVRGTQVTCRDRRFLLNLVGMVFGEIWRRIRRARKKLKYDVLRFKRRTPKRN